MTGTADLTAFIPKDLWHEHIGPVLWHHLGKWGEICEAPIVAVNIEDLEAQEPWDNYFTHWSRLPTVPQHPVRAMMLAPPGMLICDGINHHERS